MVVVMKMMMMMIMMMMAIYEDDCDDDDNDDDDDDDDDDSHYNYVYPQLVYALLSDCLHPSMNPLIEQTRLSAIKLKHFHMLRTELTLRPDHHHHHRSNNNNHHHHQSTTGNHHNHNRNHRRGIYLDDVLWRFVNKLLAELLYNNTLSMMILITSAAANHTTNVIDKARY